MELEEEMNHDRQALLEEFERRKRACQINVSTDDKEVKRNLRQKNQFACLVKVQLIDGVVFETYWPGVKWLCLI
jgi:hypothetical protein